MSNDDAGKPETLLEALEKIQNLGGGLLVEVTGRFVGEEILGLSDKGASEDYTLLLAAGEFAGAMVGAVGEANFSQEGFGGRPGGGGIYTADQQGHHDVFKGCKFRQEGLDLPDEAETLVAEGGEG